MIIGSKKRLFFCWGGKVGGGHLIYIFLWELEKSFEIEGKKKLESTKFCTFSEVGTSNKIKISSSERAKKSFFPRRFGKQKKVERKVCCWGNLKTRGLIYY